MDKTGKPHSNFFTDTKKIIQTYLEDRLTLVKLQAVKSISKIASAVFISILLLIVGFFVLLFLSVMLGYLFSALLHSYYWGFGIITAFYLVLFILIITVGRRMVSALLINTIIKLFFDKSKDND